MSLQYIYLALLMGFSASSLFYYIFFSKGKTTTFYLSKGSKIPPRFKGFVNFFAGDLLSLIPEEQKKKTINSQKVDKILRASGNPWNITKVDFFAIRLSLTLLGGVVGVIFFLISSTSMSAEMRYVILVLLPILGWAYPMTTHTKLAKEREQLFKKSLPEAIDYLSMAMSSNITLQNAFENIIQYLPTGPVKDEFILVVKSVRSGKTMESSLNELATRCPTYSIEAFVKALNNANTNNVPMLELLHARAEASRKDYETEISIRISHLPTKIFLIIGPVSVFSIVVVAAVPQIITIMGI